MNECCICHKQLKSWQTFGPLHYPVCQAHFWEFGERLEEINAMGSHHRLSVEKEQAFSELVAGIYMSKERQEIADLEKEIKDWEDEIEYHRSEIWHYEDLVASNRRKIREIKARMTKSPAGRDTAV